MARLPIDGSAARLRGGGGFSQRLTNNPMVSLSNSFEPPAPRPRCSFADCRYGRREIVVPANIFQADGRVAEEFRNQTFGDAYVSRCGYCYCTLRCWSDITAD